MKYLVRSASLTGFPDMVELYGQRPLALLDAAGIPAAALQNPELYLPYPALAKLMTLAAQRCKAADFGARLGSRQGLEVVGALGTMLCLQARVGEALTLINRHVGFHARGVSINVRTDEQQIALEMHLAFSKQVKCAQLLALSMALLVRSVAQLHGTALRPTQLELSIPTPRDPRGWRSAYGCMPKFDAAVSRVIYPVRLLELPVRIADSLRERLNAQWRGQIRLSTQSLTLTQQVERAMVALLPTGDCNLESVAGLVELHPRVLQLRLQKESLSFGALLQSTRRQLACEHLARSDIDVTTLAMNLGFGDIAVFSRAFRSWTGVSPRTWRQQQLTSTAGKGSGTERFG